jgi:hypothetical protein
MNTYEIWVRLNKLQTAHIRLQASDFNTARLMAEAQYGTGNVLCTSQVNG